MRDYLTVDHIPIKLLNRLFLRISIDPINGCWIWNGADVNGYGNVRINKIGYRVHRLMYAWKVGPIPNGKGKEIPVLDHICNNRICCNPEHLRLISDTENILRGNGATAKKARQVFCKRGHLLPGHRKGHRCCQICHRLLNHRNYYFRYRTRKKSTFNKKKAMIFT